MFRNHRERFLARLTPHSIALLHAAPERVFSNDVHYVYRQDSDFYYLTGLEEPGAIAVFRPNAPDGKRYVLFVRAHDARREAYDGPRPGPEGAISDYGADAAFPVAEFETRLLHFEGPGRTPSGYLSGVRHALYLRRRRRGPGGEAPIAPGPMRARSMKPPVLTDDTGDP